VRGVVPSGQNPHKMWRIGADGRMTPLLQVEGIAEPYNAPRQALPLTYWQTGHIDAIRVRTIYEKRSLSGDVILPVVLDPRYMIDIDTLRDWQRAEWLIAGGDFPFVRPGPSPRPLPDDVQLVVFDFDGVMTDNRVWVDEQGRESVAAYRSDSLGLKALLKAGVQALVISTETNPVVAARCRKVGLEYFQSIESKAEVLRDLLQERRIDPARAVFVGNDINDIPCFPLVGCAVVVADAQPEALSQADLVLKNRGGHGAVRELCDLIIRSKNERP